MPRGELVGGTVVVRDEREGTQLYNKGAFGTPRSGGGLEMSLVEAAYLVEAGRLEVEGAARGAEGRGMTVLEILGRGAATEAAFEVRWLVYRDLRGRTMTPKAASSMDYQLWARGTLPGRDAPSHLVKVVSESELCIPHAVAEAALHATRFRRRLLYALVDEEADVTYYEVKVENLASPASAPAGRVPVQGVEAMLLSERVLVQDPSAVAALGAHQYGHLLGPLLELSLSEAAYLVSRGALHITPASVPGEKRPEEKRPEEKRPEEKRPEEKRPEEVDADALARRAAKNQPDFALRHAAYADLRDRGLVPKTGFKYGTHFRVYDGSAEETHAPFLVHAVDARTPIPWPDIAGWVRVAHGVRKELLLFVDGTYLRLTWTRP
ncbi:MAG: tRNA-intron lyase [Thermoplasmatota archaeon]